MIIQACAYPAFSEGRDWVKPKSRVVLKKKVPRGSAFIGGECWRASVAAGHLHGNNIENRGCLFYIYGRTYVILYFDPPYFCVRSAFDPVPNFTERNPPV